MIKIESSTVIKCPVDKVWGFLSEIKNAPKWDRGVVEASQTSEGPVGVGATVQTVRKFLGRQRIGKYKISEFEPNRKIGLQAEMGPFRGQIVYRMEPSGINTKLTSTGEGEFTGFYRVIAPVFVWMFTRDNQADLANVKRVMES